MLRKRLLAAAAAAMLTACAPARLTAPEATAQSAVELTAVNSMLTQTRSAIPRKLRTTPLPPPTTQPGFSFEGTQYAGVSPTAPQPTVVTPAPVLETPTLPAPPLPVTGATESPPIPLPITGATAAATQGAPPTGDCNHVLDAGAAGPRVRLAIKNEAKGAVILTVGLSRPNSFGECGYLSWPPIPKSSKVVVDVPEVHTERGDACYWAYALITNRSGQASISGKNLCIGPNQHWVVVVNNNRIELQAH